MVARHPRRSRDTPFNSHFLFRWTRLFALFCDQVARRRFPQRLFEVPVAVVCHLRAPFTGHIEPSEPMSSVLPAVNGDYPVAVDGHSTGNVSGPEPSAPPLEPTKFSRLLVVMQQLAQPRAGQSRTSSHDDLAK